MIVKWEVDDGYVGKARPQETVIDDYELEELTEEEIEEFIEERVREDFAQNISFYINEVCE